MSDCPTPFKQRFTSRREARAASMSVTSRNLSKRKGKRVSKIQPDIYECRCRGYHLTTRVM
jgi:hypothetical protein